MEEKCDAIASSTRQPGHFSILETNFKMATDVAGLLANGTVFPSTSGDGNMSDGSSDDSLCRGWVLPQHGIYQIGCFVLATGFLVPANFGISQSLWLRVMLCIGFACYVLWAGLVHCFPDALGWSLVFVVINLCQSIYIIYNVMPVKFEDDMEEVYNALFKPFNITPQQFKRLVDSNGELYELDTTGHYAIEGRSPVDEKLSLLVSGRAKVTAEGTFLHFVDRNQFLDSPEWESCTPGAGNTFQVTITAVEKCRYIQWSRKQIKSFLQKEPFLKAVFETLIGKDIMTKLYSLNAAPQNDETSPHLEITEELATETTDTEEREDKDRRADFQHHWSPVKDNDSDIESLQSEARSAGSTPSMKSCVSMVDIRASIASGKGAGGLGLASRLDGIGSSYSQTSNGLLKPPSLMDSYSCSSASVYYSAPDFESTV
ncbi:blood vessel epicardial substance-B-like [Ptychodera flava]|uniref:blood vessel epicardial substance-B-like n=1 Tax=Ptychodera flava TaxID=63121 RepID=UPI00396A3EAE